MDKDTLIKVTNRNSNRVGYRIPETGVRRQFTKRETKEIPFGELQSLVYVPGGLRILKEYLIIKDADAIKELGINVEPEYFYSEEDIKKLLTTGTLNEFLDCLDFAPDGVLDSIKELAVSLPLDNMSKRNAIYNKLGFNVTKAIEIKNTKLDGGEEDNFGKIQPERRAATPQVEIAEKERRAEIPKYKVTTIKED